MVFIATLFQDPYFLRQLPHSIPQWPKSFLRPPQTSQALVKALDPPPQPDSKALLLKSCIIEQGEIVLVSDQRFHPSDWHSWYWLESCMLQEDKSDCQYHPNLEASDRNLMARCTGIIVAQVEGQAKDLGRTQYSNFAKGIYKKINIFYIFLLLLLIINLFI